MVNIGFIGSGVTIRTYLPAFREHKNLNVLGLTSASYEKAKLIAGESNIPKVYTSYKELIQDPQIDLVCVASPNNFHFEQLKLAIENKKHIFAEKPLANNIKEIQEINKILKTTDFDNNKLSIINHQIRFNPHILKILSFINNKTLGEVYFVKIHQPFVVNASCPKI